MQYLNTLPSISSFWSSPNPTSPEKELSTTLGRLEGTIKALVDLQWSAVELFENIDDKDQRIQVASALSNLNEKINQFIGAYYYCVCAYLLCFDKIELGVDKLKDTLANNINNLKGKHYITQESFTLLLSIYCPEKYQTFILSDQLINHEKIQKIRSTLPNLSNNLEFLKSLENTLATLQALIGTDNLIDINNCNIVNSLEYATNQITSRLQNSKGIANPTLKFSNINSEAKVVEKEFDMLEIKNHLTDHLISLDNFFESIIFTYDEMIKAEFPKNATSVRDYIKSNIIDTDNNKLKISLEEFNQFLKKIFETVAQAGPEKKELKLPIQGHHKTSIMSDLLKIDRKEALLGQLPAPRDVLELAKFIIASKALDIPFNYDLYLPNHKKSSASNNIQFIETDVVDSLRAVIRDELRIKNILINSIEDINGEPLKQIRLKFSIPYTTINQFLNIDDMTLITTRNSRTLILTRPTLENYLNSLIDFYIENTPDTSADKFIFNCLFGFGELIPYLKKILSTIGETATFISNIIEHQKLSNEFEILKTKLTLLSGQTPNHWRELLKSEYLTQSNKSLPEIISRLKDLYSSLKMNETVIRAVYLQIKLEHLDKLSDINSEVAKRLSATFRVVDCLIFIEHLNKSSKGLSNIINSVISICHHLNQASKKQKAPAAKSTSEDLLRRSLTPPIEQPRKLTHLLRDGEWIEFANYFKKNSIQIKSWKGSDINTSHSSLIQENNSQSVYPLHIAASNQQYFITHFLLIKGRDPNERGAQGRTALHIAVTTHRLITIEILNRYGIDFLAIDDKGHTPFHSAVIFKNINFIKMYKHKLEGRLDIIASLFQLAVERQDIVVLKQLKLIFNLEGSTLIDSQGYSLMHFVSRSKGIEMILTIHEIFSIEYHIKTSTGEQPIHIAASTGNIQALKALISFGINVDERDFQGLTPLFYAAINMKQEAFRCLLDNGADINARTLCIENLLHYTLKAKISNKLKTQIINFILNEYEYLSSRMNSEENIKLHLSIYLNAKDGLKNTVLYYAVEDEAIFTLIVAHNADTTTLNEYQQTFLHHAVIKRNYAISFFLLAHWLMSDAYTMIRHKDKSGKTASSYIEEKSGEGYLLRLIVEYYEKKSHKVKEEKPETITESSNITGTFDFSEIEKILQSSTSEKIIPVRQSRSIKETLQKMIVANRDLLEAYDRNGLTLLHLSARHGNYEIVDLLISFNAPTDKKDKAEMTPLHYAAMYGFLEIVKLFAKHMNNLDQIDRRGFTPLHYACLHNHREIATYLIKNGANILAKNKLGHTPLHYSTHIPDTGFMDYIYNLYILSTNTQKNSVMGEELPILFYAADVRNFFALSNWNCAVEAKRIFGGYSLLHYLARHGDSELITIIGNAYGIQFDVVNNKTGETPLHVAAQYNNTSAIKTFIGLGIKVDQPDGAGRSPLMHSAQCNKLDALKTLLNLKANIHTVDSENATVLHYAIMHQAYDVIEYLLQRTEVRIDNKNNRGDTALFLAITANDKKSILLLLNHGAISTVLNNESMSILHMSLKLGYWDTALYILSYWQRRGLLSNMLNSIDKSNQTALDYVAEIKNKTDDIPPIIELLEHFGAKRAKDIKIESQATTPSSQNSVTNYGRRFTKGSLS